MPTPDDWAREVDEALFGNDAADAPLTWHEPGGLDLARPSSEPQGRAVSVDELDAALFGQLVDVVAVEVALEIASHHGLEQVAVADAVDFERHCVGVDADERNAALAGARQHVGLACEAHHRLAVAHVDVELGGLRQRLLDRRGDAGAQRDGVTLAVLETFDTELPVLDRQCGLVLAAHADERRKIGALTGQILGELEADARRGCVGIDRVVEQPEAVVLAHALVLLPDVGRNDAVDLPRIVRGILG